MSDRITYGSEKPWGYRPRVVDEKISNLLRLFGGVEVRGTKWCGKTWSALAFGESVTRIDDFRIRDLVENDLSLALAGAKPHVIDEWQEIPPIWDAVRRAVDADGQSKGSFILTGSSTPAKDMVSHSGAGRIARVDMSTMTLWELGKSEGLVSLADLFDGQFTPGVAPDTGLAFVADAVCCGGWPALEGSSPSDAAEAIVQYLDALFEVSVPKKGGNPRTARRIANSLARNVATAATFNTIASDALDVKGSEPAASTIATYLSLLEELFFIEEVNGWDAPVRAKSRVRTKPKRYFADPSIPATMLGVDPVRLLEDAQTFGLLFESLAMHDLKVYASVLPNASPDSLCYYRDADGLEVDAIIELRDGRWAGIEIKLGESKVPAGIKNLARLRKKVLANPAAHNREPAFMAVLTATSPFVRYDKESDVYVLPLTALRP